MSLSAAVSALHYLESKLNLHIIYSYIQCASKQENTYILSNTMQVIMFFFCSKLNYNAHLLCFNALLLCYNAILFFYYRLYVRIYLARELYHLTFFTSNNLISKISHWQPPKLRFVTKLCPCASCPILNCFLALRRLHSP